MGEQFLCNFRAFFGEMCASVKQSTRLNCCGAWPSRSGHSPNQISGRLWFRWMENVRRRARVARSHKLLNFGERACFSEFVFLVFKWRLHGQCNAPETLKSSKSIWKAGQKSLKKPWATGEVMSAQNSEFSKSHLEKSKQNNNSKKLGTKLGTVVAPPWWGRRPD